MYICYYLLLQLLVTRNDDEVQAKLRALKEAARCTKLGRANLPSICMFLHYPEHQEQVSNDRPIVHNIS